MQLQEFRALVKEFTRVDGNAYLPYSTFAAWDRAINNSLKSLTSFYPILYNTAVSFTVESGTSKYNLRDEDVFSHPVSLIDVLTIDQKTITFVNWNSVQEEERYWYGKRSGFPASYTVISPSQLLLSSMPESDYDGTLVAWVIHPTLTNDNDELLIPDEVTQFAAAYTAKDILSPYSSADTIQRISAILQQYSNAFMEFIAHGGNRHGQRAFRRGDSWKVVRF